MSVNRYCKAAIEQFTNDTMRDGFCILRGHFATPKLQTWQAEFVPLLQAHIKNKGRHENRGKNRYYVTLPFEKTFADEEVFAEIFHSRFSSNF